MSLEKLKKSIYPSVLAGAAGIGVYYFLFDSDLMTAVPFGPINVPVSLAVGGSVLIGNMAGELLTNFVLPLIPKNEMFQNYEEMVIPPALASLSTYLTMKILVSEDTQVLPALVTGGAGSIAGKYVYGMI